MTAPLHAAQRRYRAEDLVRLRRSDEQRRYAAPQRAARVDANPHQIKAVIFALGRLREGGCILADEVGLGKTIEAGLVMAQLMAEGARRVLLITPKPLLGQWRQELYQLFNIDAIEAVPRIGEFDGEGVFVIGREAAGSVKGRDALLLAEKFDLCVIDEAHEVFAGIYKRFDKLGVYDDEASVAQTAGRLREVLNASQTPVLLLTATPMQNNLVELWGLVQYVDPLGTLLGDLATFREVFCGTDERQLAQGQEEELRDRLRVVLQRTLRRDAQPFLEKPFVGREARLFPYTMSPAEKGLYDDVTQYLLEPGILAFQGRQRQLLLLGFHRRMASSTRALAVSLGRVAERLRRMMGGAARAHEVDGDVLGALPPAPAAEAAAAPLFLAVARRGRERSFFGDLEEEEGDELLVDDGDRAAGNSPGLIAELKRVERYVERAEGLGSADSKFRALLQALEFVTKRAGRSHGAGKLVIFTESLVTQGYLRDRLLESGRVSDSEITLFSGTNDSPRAHEALRRWLDEVPQGEGVKSDREIASRLALVHEFQTRSRVFISTEAGAKGLNLQFCNTVVNYDLPWNPQRIEQRIGRCHRYGQTHDVTVINFLAKDNVAQTLTFEILSQKLELFGTVLDASDQVLHRASGSVRGEVLASVLGNDVEAELSRIYDRSRTQDEVAEELRSLRDKVSEERKRFEDEYARTHDLIEKRLGEDLQRVFRGYREDVPGALADLDRDLESLVIGYLDALAIPYQLETVAEEELLVVGASLLLPDPLRDGITAALGPSKEHASLNLSHPLVQAAVAETRASPSRMSAVIRPPDDAPEELRSLAGERGRLRLMKLSFDGFERVELLVPILLLDRGRIVPQPLAEMLLRGTMRNASGPGLSAISDDDLQDATDETLFSLQSTVDADEQKRFERAEQQAERFIEDRLLVLRRRGQSLETKMEEGRLRRDGATGSEARSEAERALLNVETSLEEVKGAIERLENRDDETFQRYQEHIHRRRYTPPRVEPLFDLDLEVE
jgi:SNF2-related domain/Helicase conserved C-terminal domain